MDSNLAIPENSSGKAIASHAHHDFCSVSLYYEGNAFLFDPGSLITQISFK